MLACLKLLFLLICLTSANVTSLLSPCTSSCSITNCKSCPNKTQCALCMDGYSTTFQNNACLANKCTVTGCGLCDSTGYCLSCTDAYSVYDVTLSACVRSCILHNCLTCKNGNVDCEQCLSGYSLNTWNGQCVAQPIKNCLRFYEFARFQFLCIKCMNGYIPTKDQTQCMVYDSKCTNIADCSSCSSSTFCLTCRVGYHTSPDNSICQPNTCVDQHCLYCSSNGDCLRCLSQYSLLGSGSCVLASCLLTNCKVCKQGSLFCDYCQAGYALNIWSKHCQAFPTGHSIDLCLQFMVDSSNQVHCALCQSGYVPSIDSLTCVVNCPLNCQTCANNICSVCKPGFTITGQTCTQNKCSASNCNLCDVSGVCIACNGYSVYNQALGSCVSGCTLKNCLICKATATTCQTCLAGYAVYKWTGQCILTLIANCAQTYDFSQQQFLCSKCANDYKPTPDQIECMLNNCPTIINCQSCSNNLICQNCRIGYHLSSNTCLPNPCTTSNCLYCDTNKICLRCSSNYTLSNGQCIAMACSLANCQVCKLYSQYCDMCNINYSIDIWKNQCENYPSKKPIVNCLAFMIDSSNEQHCAKCKIGFTPSLNSLSCSPQCPSNCLSCTNNVCNACQAGSYLSGSVCNLYTCPNGCSSCNSSGVCLTCTSPYQSYNSTLKKCVDFCSIKNCAKCQRGSNICEMCISSYSLYQLSGQCIVSPVANCLSLYDYRGVEFVCTKCVSGSIPTSDQIACMINNCSLIQDCQICNGSEICSSCRIGFSFDKVSGKCLQNTCKVSHCLYCDNNGLCLKCSSINTLVNGNCLAVFCPMVNCQVCKLNSIYCDVCSDGYSWNIWSKQCEKSILIGCSLYEVVNRKDFQCLECGNNNICNQCSPYYTYNNLISTCTSLCSINYCIKCSSTLTCSECDAGYTLSSNALQCTRSCFVQNCNSCLTSTSVCDLCSQGYTYNGSACVVSLCNIQNCLQCSTVSTCLMCNPLSLLTINGTCKSLCSVPNCLTCSNYLSCSICNGGFYLSPSRQCLPFCSISNCILCRDSLTCKSCAQNYILSSDYSSCTIGCGILNCDTCSNWITCQHCASGFSLINDSQGVSRCLQTTCLPGFFSNPSNALQCLACSINNCKQCTSNIACTQCSVSYYVDQNNACSLCSSLFPQCFSCNSVNCLQCVKGYTLSNQKCILQTNCNLTGCLSCFNASFCLTCSETFNLNSSNLCAAKCNVGVYQNNKCMCPLGSYSSGKSCLHCLDSKCLQCDSLTCRKCLPSYYPLINKCLSCMPNCKTCLSAAICQQCNMGFQLVNWICQFQYIAPQSASQCMLGCKQCFISNQKSVCEVIQQGYSYNLNGYLTKCSSNCKSCAQNNPNICLSCYNGILKSGICDLCFDTNCQNCGTDIYSCINCAVGFTLQMGSCKNCSSNCLICDVNGANYCDADGCVSGFSYSPTYKICTHCFNGCSRCDHSDITNCLQCSRGSYLFNGACNPCPINCLTCYSKGVCSQCSNGFSLTQGLCIATPNYPCLLQNSSNCVSCIIGYTLLNGICVLDNQLCASNCVTCPFGYYVQNSICKICPISSHCLQCDTQHPTSCIKCERGYYFNGTICTQCAKNCQICQNQLKCIVESNGYFIKSAWDLSPKGTIQACSLTCLTCINISHCTTCRDGWSLVGLQCISARSFNVSVTIKPDFVGWNDSWTQNDQMNAALKYWPLIYFKLSELLLFDADSPFGVMMTSKIATGSLQVTMTRIIQDSQNPQTISSYIQSSISAGVPGLTVLSTSMSNSQQSNNRNEVYIGVFVSVGLIVIIIIIIVVYFLKKKNQKGAKKSNNKINDLFVIEGRIGKDQIHQTSEFYESGLNHKLSPASMVQNINQKMKKFEFLHNESRFENKQGSSSEKLQIVNSRLFQQERKPTTENTENGLFERTPKNLVIDLNTYNNDVIISSPQKSIISQNLYSASPVSSSKFKMDNVLIIEQNNNENSNRSKTSDPFQYAIEVEQQIKVAQPSPKS